MVGLEGSAPAHHLGDLEDPHVAGLLERSVVIDLGHQGRIDAAEREAAAHRSEPFSVVGDNGELRRTERDAAAQPQDDGRMLGMGRVGQVGRQCSGTRVEQAAVHVQ